MKTGSSQFRLPLVTRSLLASHFRLRLKRHCSREAVEAYLLLYKFPKAWLWGLGTPFLAGSSTCWISPEPLLPPAG